MRKQDVKQRHFSRAVAAIISEILIMAMTSSSGRAGQAWRFHLEEATIADVHREIKQKQLTATQLVRMYFKRIEAYNGSCVQGDRDPMTGLQLGDITPIENAGGLNAFMTLNIRGKRSKTDTADNDP